MNNQIIKPEDLKPGQYIVQQREFEIFFLGDKNVGRVMEFICFDGENSCGPIMAVRELGLDKITKVSIAHLNPPYSTMRLATELERNALNVVKSGLYTSSVRSSPEQIAVAYRADDGSVRLKLEAATAPKPQEPEKGLIADGLQAQQDALLELLASVRSALGAQEGDDVVAVAKRVALLAQEAEDVPRLKSCEGAWLEVNAALREAAPDVSRETGIATALARVQHLVDRQLTAVIDCASMTIIGDVALVSASFKPVHGGYPAPRGNEPDELAGAGAALGLHESDPGNF